MTIIGNIADILGIISFILGIWTLCTTTGIKKSLLYHVEKSSYLENIDHNIANLKALVITLKEDEKLYTQNYLDMVVEELNCILVYYGTVIEKKDVTRIKKLKTHIEEKCSNLKDSKAKRHLKEELDYFCMKLDKEKKML